MHHLVYGGIPDGMQLIHSAQGTKRKPECSGIFTGDLYQSEAHMIYVRQAKRLVGKVAENEELKEDHRSLEGAWNENRLRCGDQVAGSSSDAGQHPNTWTFKGVLLNAWLQIGKSKVANFLFNFLRRRKASDHPPPPSLLQSMHIFRRLEDQKGWVAEGASLTPPSPPF